MVKHDRTALPLTDRLSQAALPGQVTTRPNHKKHPRTGGRLWTSAPVIFKSSGQVESLNLRCHSNFNRPSHMMAQMRMPPSCRPMSPTSTCWTISNATNEVALRGSTAFSNDSDLQAPRQGRLASPVTPLNSQGKKPLLLERLSDLTLQQQMKKTRSMKEGPVSTLTHCHNMKLRGLATKPWQTYHLPYRKPALCSRISLTTLSEPGLPYSTAASQSLRLSGSTCSV